MEHERRPACPVQDLPAVIAAETVAIAEGEKDCDTLAKVSFVATCNCGGAGKWRDEYSDALRDKHVVIFGDDDEPGREHVEEVIESLTGIARSIKRITLPEGFHDVSDYIASLPAKSPKQAVTKLIDETPALDSSVSSVRDGHNGLIPARLNSELPKVQLPGDGRLLSAFAADCAEILKNCGIYQRGGVAFIVNQHRNGLDVITAPLLRTLAEQHLVCFRVRRSGNDFVSLPRTMSDRGRNRGFGSAAVSIAFA